MSKLLQAVSTPPPCPETDPELVAAILFITAIINLAINLLGWSRTFKKWVGLASKWFASHWSRWQ